MRMALTVKTTRAGVTLALIVACCPALGQTGKWPEKPIRIIVAAPTGGGDDFVTRLMAPKLSDLLGRQFIAENRSGAGGLIGQTVVLKAPADGYTFLLAGGSMAGARYVNAQATYDVLRDFTPVSQLETSPFVLVVYPGVPAKNLKEYIALARSQPGKMTYATLGAGQMPFWNALLFNSMAGIKAVEVQYKNFAEGVIDVISGRIDYFIVPSALAVANRDRLRALAVTGTMRLLLLPEVPSMAEAGLPGYDLPSWRSIMGPAGVRPDIVDALNGAIRQTLAMPDIRERLTQAGSQPAPSSPEELRRRYAEWMQIFGKIATETGLKPQ